MQAIIDTGSFELLVFSTRCRMCGDAGSLFSESTSISYNAGTLIAQHSFGSGSTESLEAFDIVRIGSMESKKQVFWEVIKAKMPVLAEASFQAILGVGPPRSAVVMAQEDEDAAKTILKVQHSPRAQRDVEHYADVVAHAKQVSSLATGLGLQTFSFCLESDIDGPGWLIWHDTAPMDRPPDVFGVVDVVGDLYWSAQMTATRLVDPSSDLEGTSLGCSEQACSVVLDSGTSLLSAPSSVVTMIEELLSKRPNQSDKCSDLTGLPELHFHIAGHAFSLPPDSYVSEVTDIVSSDLAKLLPHLNRRGRSTGCVTALLTLDTNTQFGPLWVLGMPFFRKYYSTFHFSDSRLPRPGAQSMAFAPHDGHCQPKHRSLLGSDEGEKTSPLPMRVELSKVRASPWVHHAARAGRIHV